MPPLLEPAGHRLIDLAVYVGSGAVVGAGGDVYAYRTPAGLPLTYPPFAALLAEPLGRVPLVVVQGGWTLATVAAVVAVARVARAPVVARIGLPVTVTLLLVSTPVRSHLRFGQVGLFLVLLVVLDLLGRERARGWGVLAATSVALSPISWQHHLVWLVLPLAALVAADRCRLAAVWVVVLVLPVTTVGTMLDVPVLGALVVDACGLTAVATVLLLPRLLSPAPARRRAATPRGTAAPPWPRPRRR